MAEATRTLDLTEILPVLDAWQDIGHKAQQRGTDPRGRSAPAGRDHPGDSLRQHADTTRQQEICVRPLWTAGGDPWPGGRLRWRI